METETGHDPALWRALGDLGVTGLMVVPPALGGAGLDLLDALDGVFWLAPDGTLRFHALPPPTDAEVARLVATIARRVGKLLARRGLGDGEISPARPADTSRSGEPSGARGRLRTALDGHVLTEVDALSGATGRERLPGTSPGVR